MKSEPQLTAARLRELLHYNPETGVFTNRITRSSRAQRGAVAGSLGVNGYIEIRLDWTLYYGHRLAWLYMTGEWPSCEVDHRDTVRSNNRWANLRNVTHQVNLQNQRKAQAHSSTGLLGVARKTRGRPYAVTIRSGGKQQYIGTFDSADVAYAAYVAAKRKLHEGCTL